MYEENRREQARQQKHQAEMRAMQQRAEERERQRMLESERHRQRTAAALTGRSSCFTSNTPVLTSEGWRRIDEIEPGQTIMTIDRKGTLVGRRVAKRKDYSARGVWLIQTAGRVEPVETTGSHTLLTARGWVRTSRLRVGDILVAPDADHGRVTQVIRTSRFQPVHNLITEGEHTFIAAGFVVHNFTHFRAIRTALYQLWELISLWTPRATTSPRALPCSTHSVVCR
jgi:hypothetical protein